LGDYELKKFRQTFDDKAGEYLNSYGSDEPGQVSASMIETKVPDKSISTENIEAILAHMYGAMTINQTGILSEITGFYCSDIVVSPTKFTVSMSVMAKDTELLNVAGTEIQEITKLSGIVIDTEEVIPAYDTDTDNNQVETFLEIYERTIDSKYEVDAMSCVSELGYLHEKAPDLPLLTIGYDVNAEDANLTEPGNALLKYIYQTA
jgi:hypothetical protein